MGSKNNIIGSRNKSCEHEVTCLFDCDARGKLLTDEFLTNGGDCATMSASEIFFSYFSFFMSFVLKLCLKQSNAVAGNTQAQTPAPETCRKAQGKNNYFWES